jgi:hypothetical protein
VSVSGSGISAPHLTTWDGVMICGVMTSLKVSETAILICLPLENLKKQNTGNGNRKIEKLCKETIVFGLSINSCVLKFWTQKRKIELHFFYTKWKYFLSMKYFSAFVFRVRGLLASFSGWAERVVNLISFDLQPLVFRGSKWAQRLCDRLPYIRLFWHVVPQMSCWNLRLWRGALPGARHFWTLSELLSCASKS